MGTDIHSVGQVFKDGKWITKIARPGGDDRNYDSFAVLADVRNGYGFAGCATGEGWPVISEPRGLPNDIRLNDRECIPTPSWQYDFEKGTSKYRHEVWMGDHSHSWLLLSEIENFVETKLVNMKYTKTGVVSKKTYEDFKNGKIREPQEYCGWTSGPNVEVVSEEKVNDSDYYTHVQMNWEVNAVDCLYTLKKYIEELRGLANKEGVDFDKVRLVFGFDS